MDDTIFLRYSGNRLLEDDIVEFVAIVNGLITYEALMGNDITIPDLTAISLRITEDAARTPAPPTVPIASDSPTPSATGSTTASAPMPMPSREAAESKTPMPVSSPTSLSTATTMPQATISPQATLVVMPTLTTQPTPTPSAGERSRPIPLNQVASYPSWDISVMSFDGNANSEIAEENQFNEPPPDGHVYVLVHVQGIYTGTEFGSLWLDLDYYVVGNTNITYDQAWVVTPNDLSNLPDALPGGSVGGNLAFLVPEDVVGSLLLLVTDGGLRYANTIGYFSLYQQATDNYSTPSPSTSLVTSSTPLPEATQAPAPSEVQQTTSTSPIGNTGERSNPIQLNQVASYPSWDISVVSFDGNANSEIDEENQFNEPPPDGHVYVLVHVQGTYTGTEFGSLWLDLDYYVVGNTNITYDQAWVVTPNDLSNLPDALPGGTIGGNLVFLVPEDVVGSLLLLVSDGGLRYAETIGYFSLR